MLLILCPYCPYIHTLLPFGLGLTHNCRACTTENNDSELGDAVMIQKSVQGVSERLKLHENNDENNDENNAADQFSPSIYTAPRMLRDLSTSSFSPREVSIGPLHREGENVQAFEWQKETYVIKLMSRIGSGSSQEAILNLCMQKVYVSMAKIKACYGYIQMMTRDQDNIKFAERMVMDACFILEFTLPIESIDESYRGNMLPDQTIIYDLVLLENQIPSFILNEIFQCTVLKFRQDAGSLIDFIRPLLNLLNIFKDNIKTEKISISNTDHILSLLHQCYKPQGPIRSTFLTSTMPSALDLDNAGVHLKPSQNPTWLMEMEVKLPRFPCFSWCWGKPTLRMPVLYVHDFTELVLRNLIAYEHRSSQTHNYITSYAYAMDMLVNTQHDVAKLVDSRVLVNSMGSDEEATKMINNICKEVAQVHFFYGENFEKLNKYCRGYWPERMAWLKTTYFSSPWSLIALGVGTILFALTVVQTIYAIKST
ncbi:hypothetical protein HanXRQr2_Chr01g0020741 [Helianthus annuus]|uniref:Uncharacterized protein n=1 Tax=Helianthus annuus TaxID=4232 RepID=A0A251UGW1_HELAN|nr:hypothetical protein HanXRQr2_Chr01g0020741 [Helianthus annuus]KAJ0622595.1 hypothetical protein HanIR_Chr01g0022421 [Helianthus annuus]KAJ0626833.1 hypothetical protein HanHA89_Chr01g0018491 [Helianthus annuus]